MLQNLKPSGFAPIVALVCGSSISLAASATNQSSNAKAVLEHGVRDAISILEKEKPGTASSVLSKKVRPIAEKIFNFESITRKALGQSWKDLSPEQQKQAVALFSEILIRKYVSHFVADNKPQLTFLSPQDLGNGRLEISSTTLSGGNSYSVIYRLETSSTGWRVYDVNIEGVSLVSNYRSQFDSVRQRSPGNSEALLQAMKDSLQP